MNDPIPPNRPKGSTASPSPDAYRQATQQQEIGMPSRLLTQHLQEAGAKVNMHRAP